MAGAAQLIEHHCAVVSFELVARGRSSGVLNNFRNLWHTIINARQCIGLVINDDEHLKLVELHHPIRKQILSHRRTSY